MRVAINAEQLFHPSPGGIGRYTAQLLRLVPEVRPDVEMVPVTGRHSRASVVEVLGAAGADGGTVRRAAVQAWPTAAMYEAWVTLGRPRLRGIDGASVVHAPSVAVPPASGRPLVVTVHDAASLVFPEGFTARARRFHRLGLAAAARRADAIITVSGAAAEELVARTGIAADRISVVPNGVDPPAAAPDVEARVLEAMGLGDRPFVLWVGSLEPRKGVGTLVAAMAELRRRGAGVRADTVLAGYDGWLHDDLVDGSDRLVLGASLRQLGRVSEAQLWALYRRADLFVFPSAHEGFGLPVLEAMSQGLPVVASDIAALREVAGRSAVFVGSRRPGAWADAIEGLLGDVATRRGLGEAGRIRSRSFTGRAMAAATHAVYQAVGS